MAGGRMTHLFLAPTHTEWGQLSLSSFEIRNISTSIKLRRLHISWGLQLSLEHVLTNFCDDWSITTQRTSILLVGTPENLRPRVKTSKIVFWIFFKPFIQTQKDYIFHRHLHTGTNGPQNSLEIHEEHSLEQSPFNIDCSLSLTTHNTVNMLANQLYGSRVILLQRWLHNSK